MDIKGKVNIVETDLYNPIKEFFTAQGFVVKGEVLDCDISAVKGDLLIAVELKRHLTVELLAQGVKRQSSADAVYLAIPKPKKMRITAKWKYTLNLLRRLELGLIIVSLRGDYPLVEVVLEAGNQDGKATKAKNSKEKRNRMLAEISGRHGDFNIGGSSGKKLVTAYREKAIFIACCLNLRGPLTPKELRALGTDPRKTTSILYENYYGWFERIDRGLYALTPRGREDLKLYPELAAYYSEKIGGHPE